MSSGIIKPSFNSRLVQGKQQVAEELAFRQKQNHRLAEEKEINRIRDLHLNSFNNKISKKQLRQKRLNESVNRFNDNLAYMISVIAYKASPHEDKGFLRENCFLEDQPKAFINLFEHVKDLFATDASIKRCVGDYYSRTSELNFGNLSGITAATINAASAVDMQRRPTVDVEDNGINFNVMDTVDSLIYFGDTAAGLEKDSRYETVSEFVEVVAEEVNNRVLIAYKQEAERADKQAFLHEAAKENMYAFSSNKNIANQVKKESILNEVAMTVFAINHDKGNNSTEELMNESVLQYSLLETLNTVGLLNKSVAEIKETCMNARRRYRNKNM